jgi:hypothetical protein
MGMIVDRCPAESINIETKDAPGPSPIVSPSPVSASPSPSVGCLQAALGKGGKSVTVDDHVMIPKFGLHKDLDGLATKEFGSDVILNTLIIHDNRTSMSAPQFAKLLEIMHEISRKKIVTGLRSLYSWSSGKEPGVWRTVEIG